VQQDVVDLLECPNCSTPLSRQYCPQCGQKIGDINPTIHDLLHDVTHEFLHLDSKIFRTVTLLLLRPGFLTRAYFDGRRVRYVSPIRVYLVFSVIYFAAATWIERPMFRSDENVEVGALAAALGLENMSPEEANRLMADVQAHWIPRLMFVLVPVSALLVQLVTRHTGRNYPQHLSFALHIHAAFFALLAATIVVDLLNVEWLNAAVSLSRTALLVIYTVVAFHQAYGGGWGVAVGRTAFVLTGYMLVITVAAALSVAVYAANH
jgi:Protein of unknown function (DUF3667).